jgi:hypothetical protein
LPFTITRCARGVDPQQIRPQRTFLFVWGNTRSLPGAQGRGSAGPRSLRSRRKRGANSVLSTMTLAPGKRPRTWPPGSRGSPATGNPLVSTLIGVARKISRSFDACVPRRSLHGRPLKR